MANVESGALPFRPLTPPRRAPFPGPILSSPQKFDPATGFKNGHLNLDTFSPVNKDGSFEFDRIIKSGRVHCRIKKKGAWKASWKPVFLVLRPNLLSIYQDEDESGLRGSITLSDVTAVALVKKTHADNVFGVFTPSKNYHFQGQSARDTAEWVEQVRSEARVDTLDDMILASPELPERQHDDTGDELSAEDAAGTSTAPSVPRQPTQSTGSRSRASTAQRRTSHLNDYSSNEVNGSHSDFSDVPVGSLPKNMISAPTIGLTLSPIASDQNLRPVMPRNASQMSGFDPSTDPERVIRQGWLQVLKSKGGVKQWKNLWVVLRPKTLAFYKNEQEYSAVKLVSISSIIDAAEVDPVSKSRTFCLQIILDDRTYKCSAPDEDALASWLGALKSVLAKRQEMRKVTEGTAALAIR
jgi:hypothetical protein